MARIARRHRRLPIGNRNCSHLAPLRSRKSPFNELLSGLEDQSTKFFTHAAMGAVSVLFAMAGVGEAVGSSVADCLFQEATRYFRVMWEVVEVLISPELEGDCLCACPFRCSNSGHP